MKYTNVLLATTNLPPASVRAQWLKHCVTIGGRFIITSSIHGIVMFCDALLCGGVDAVTLWLEGADCDV